MTPYATGENDARRKAKYRDIDLAIRPCSSITGMHTLPPRLAADMDHKLGVVRSGGFVDTLAVPSSRGVCFSGFSPSFSLRCAVPIPHNVQE